MENFIRINRKINSFSKKIKVEGDKSLSIRWVILSSLSKKKSIANNLNRGCLSDLLHKDFRIKSKNFKNKCEVTGNGFNFENLRNKKN